VQAERKRAEDELRRRRPTPALTEDDIRTLVESLVDLVGLLEAAEPQKKAALYESLGLSLTYEPRRLRVLVEVDLSGVRPVRFGGPKSPNCHPEWRIRPWPPAMQDEESLPVGEDRKSLGSTDELHDMHERLMTQMCLAQEDGARRRSRERSIERSTSGHQRARRTRRIRGPRLPFRQLPSSASVLERRSVRKARYPRGPGEAGSRVAR